mgnify:CR=1 FL=1
MATLIYKVKPIRRLIVALVDMIIVIFSLTSALLLRFDGQIPPATYENFLRFIGPALIICLIFFYLFGFYRRIWRYTSVDDLITIFYAVTTAMVAVTLFGYYVLGVRLPFSVYLISYVAMGILIGASRLAVRLLNCRLSRPQACQSNCNLAIIGAGEAGNLVARELKKHGPAMGVNPVGFVDDDPQKHNLIINGLPVLGPINELPRLVEENKINDAVVAMPSAPYAVLQQIIRNCSDLKVQIKTMPGIYEILNGQVSLKALKDVEIEDLLKRSPVQLDLPSIAAYLSGLNILVTGAGGSIGAELCRQIAFMKPQRLIMLDNDENAIFFIYNELQDQYPDLEICPIICDIKEYDSLQRVFQAHRPQVVFHAAAHKHVPLMELNIEEAINNNIEGSKNVIDLASLYKVKKFVGISTDKAVNPTSVMGATKRAVEIYLQNKAHLVNGCVYCSVRFGNVLGSQGSVVPLFRQQIKKGGPVRVTHPEITRYFMTIPEAVQLVIQAGALGQGGEIFVLDMGEPIKINDLARDMISLSGLVPDRDIEIVHTGLRPGEKLYEELFSERESFARTKHERIFIAPDTEYSQAEIDSELERLSNLLGLNGGLGEMLEVGEFMKTD